MSELQGIWVVVESTPEGQLTENSQELLTPARRFADQLGQPLTALVIGSLCAASVAASGQLGALGADRVMQVQVSAGEAYDAQQLAAVLAQLINQHHPAVVLATSSTTSMDYLPRVAVRIQGGLVTNASDLALEANGRVAVTRSCFAESLLSSAMVPAGTQLITVKKKAFPKPVENPAHTAPTESVSVDVSSVVAKTKVLAVNAAVTQGAKKLEEADIIVSGGRGLKEAGNFHVVEELAEALGAAVGASRAVVDAGWRPHAEQVGQTGKTVSPKVYFALGISGAIQHLVGMNTSGLIIAINRDENAPIFKLADFGIVGDALTIVPELTRTIKSQNLALHV